jgi:hypothetical protein
MTGKLFPVISDVEPGNIQQRWREANQAMVV